METPFDTIISIVTLLFGGGGIGALLGWRWQKRKAKAEAKQAEAEAEKAKFEATQANTQLIKDIQSSYQQLASDLKANLDTQQEYNDEQKQYISELKQDRQHLREERDELRGRIDKLESTQRDLQFEVARNSRMVAFMRPFLCGREGCAIRTPVPISATGEIEKPEPKDIEPYDDKD
jgi:predicted RNase H-like nuclease (RuvC/YqgF family)